MDTPIRRCLSPLHKIVQVNAYSRPSTPRTHSHRQETVQGFTEKNPRIRGPVLFQLMLFEGQLCTHTHTCVHTHDCYSVFILRE